MNTFFFRYRLHVCTTCIKKYQILRKGRGRRRVRYLLSPETREMWMWKQRCSATIFFHSINPTRDGDAIQKEAFRRKFQCFRFHEKQFDQAGIFKNDLVVFLYSSGYEFFFLLILKFQCFIRFCFLVVLWNISLNCLIIAINTPLKKVKRLEHQQFYEYGFFKDQWTKMFSAKFDQKKNN